MQELTKTYWCFSNGTHEQYKLEKVDYIPIETERKSVSTMTGVFKLSRTKSEDFPWLLVVCLWPGIAEAYLAADAMGLQEMLSAFVPLCKQLYQLGVEGNIPLQ